MYFKSLRIAFFTHEELDETLNRLLNEEDMIPWAYVEEKRPTSGSRGVAVIKFKVIDK